jgi:predicted GNAT superfamily acetyltransferase
MTDPVISAALESHVPGILALNAAARASVMALDATTLAQSYSHAPLLVVAERAQEVVGYLIAYSTEQPTSHSEFTWFNDNRRAFCYLDQIVVQQSSRRQGIGRLLCQHATQWAEGKRMKSLVTTANIRPHDAVALSFHRALGFRQSGELDTSDGRRVVLLERRFTSTLQPWKEALSGFHGTSQQQQQ